MLYKMATIVAVSPYTGLPVVYKFTKDDIMRVCKFVMTYSDGTLGGNQTLYNAMRVLVDLISRHSVFNPSVNKLVDLLWDKPLQSHTVQLPLEIL